MRDEFSTSTAPDPRCGFIRINQRKLTANGPATTGRLRIRSGITKSTALRIATANKVGHLQNQFVFIAIYFRFVG